MPAFGSKEIQVKNWALHALFAVLGILLAACGDDSGDAKEPPLDGGSGFDGGAEASTSAESGPPPGDASADGEATEGGGAEGADADAGSVDTDAAAASFAEELCESLVQGTCDWFLKCRSQTLSCEDAGPTRVVKARCETTVAAIKAGRAEVDMSRAADCLRELEESACVGPPVTVRAMNTFGRDANACSGLFVGTAPLDGDCYSNEIFSSDGCGEGFCSGSCPGKCRPFAELGDDCATIQCAPGSYCGGSVCKAYKKEGQSCAADGAQCAPGLYCDEEQRCQSFAGQGESCETAAECQSGFVCAPEKEGGSNVCTVPAKEGEPCWSDTSCNSRLFLCVDDVCTLGVEHGAPCFDERNCPEGDTCLRDDRESEFGICDAPLGADAPCNAETDCADGFWCVNATGTPQCTERLGVGDSCSMGVPCRAELYCDLRTTECAARGSVGDDCDREQYDGCEDSLHCAWNGKCVSRGGEGDPCTALTTGSCDLGLFCDRTDHTCEPPSGEDGPCLPGEFESCEEGLYCACDGQECSDFDPGVQDPGEVCEAMKPNGQACGSSTQCTSGSCVDGKCAAATAACTGPPMGG